ncbi:MAG TPA: glycoside hydrolase family 88 protein [Bacteroidota bacterium]
MKLRSALPFAVATVMVLAAASHCFGQEKAGRRPAIRLARAIADRIIQDTDLSLRQVPLKDAAGNEAPQARVTELAVKPDAIYRRESYAEWTYYNGTVLLSLLGLSRASGEPAYEAFVRRVCDFTLAHLDTFRSQYATLRMNRGADYRMFQRTMLDYTGGPVLPYQELLPGSNDGRLRTLVGEMGRYVAEGQVRLPDRTLCRPEPPSYTIWADDLFMGLPCLVRMGEQSGVQAYFDDAATQVVNFNRYLADSVSGLYRHAYFVSRKQQSPFAWGRANGWVIWAETEVLLHTPKTHPSYQAIAEIFRRHMKALVAVQGSSGLWHQVLDHSESFEETSCSAMFMIGLARGLKMGLLDETYRAPLQKAWEGLRSKITEGPIVKDICRGTGIGEELSFYLTRERFDNDPHGLGAVITALTEADGLVE